MAGEAGSAKAPTFPTICRQGPHVRAREVGAYAAAHQLDLAINLKTAKDRRGRSDRQEKSSPVS
jgi:hypothetical protein